MKSQVVSRLDNGWPLLLVHHRLASFPLLSDLAKTRCWESMPLIEVLVCAMQSIFIETGWHVDIGPAADLSNRTMSTPSDPSLFHDHHHHGHHIARRSIDRRHSPAFLARFPAKAYPAFPFVFPISNSWPVSSLQPKPRGLGVGLLLDHLPATSSMSIN